MAFLKSAKTEQEIRKTPVSQLRKDYSVLADEYNKILDGKFVYCNHCGKWLTRDSFYSNKDNSNGLETYACKKCLLEMTTDKGKEGLIDNKEKAKNVLQRLDLPFIEETYDNAVKDCTDGLSEKNRSAGWLQYLTMILSLPNWKNYHWCDSQFLDDEEFGVSISKKKPRKEIVKLFGYGLSNEDYLYLQDQYDDWKLRTQVDSKSQETYIVRICFKLLDIWKAQKAGKDTEKLDTSLNKLMESANLQPRQNVGNAATDSLTFSQLIEKWEMEKPIPEPEPEFKDVDGIGKYIRIWFKGHLSRALGLDNGYSKEYDDYIKKYTVTKPEEQNMDEKSDTIYSQIFGDIGE